MFCNVGVLASLKAVVWKNKEDIAVNMKMDARTRGLQDVLWMGRAQDHNHWRI
jgi:hypothetical protein